MQKEPSQKIWLFLSLLILSKYEFNLPDNKSPAQAGDLGGG